MAVRSNLHTELFLKNFHGEDDSVKNALLHIISTSKRNKEVWNILNVLAFDLEATEIKGKGVLHWIAEFDRVDLMTFMIDALEADKHERISPALYRSESTLKKMHRLPGRASPFLYSDSSNKTPYHYVKSVIMIKVFDASANLYWYLQIGGGGVSTFTQLLREGRYDLAAAIKNTNFRFEHMKKHYFPLLIKPSYKYRHPELVIDRKNVLKTFWNSFQKYFMGRIPEFTVAFVGEYAIDAGGPTQEFFSLGLREIFQGTESVKPYFETIDDKSMLYAPSHNYAPIEFRYIGGFIALAIFNNIPTGVEMIPMFYQEIYGFSDWTKEMFEKQDPSFAESLSHLTKPETDLDSLELYLDDEATIKVNSSNVGEYCWRLMEQKLVDQHKERIRAFAEGFNSILNETVQKHLTPLELSCVLKGKTVITAKEFLENIQIQKNNSSEKVVQFFINIVYKLSSDQIMKIIQFTTGVDRLPFGGVAAMNHRMTVSFIDASADSLPQAGTCSHFLFIPRYNSEKRMREKLIYAIEEGQHFALENDTGSDSSDSDGSDII